MFTGWMPFLSPVQSLVQQIYSHCAERERNICLYLGLNTQTSDCEVRPPPLGYHITLGESSLFLEDRVICLLGQCVHTDPPLALCPLPSWFPTGEVNGRSWVHGRTLWFLFHNCTKEPKNKLVKSDTSHFAYSLCLAMEILVPDGLCKWRTIRTVDWEWVKWGMGWTG
uniref:Uncharacterized protein n=1 Tax=Micrurus corallinus TaxID=54390 RepID=A0A2D4EXQ0_MICCO